MILFNIGFAIFMIVFGSIYTSKKTVKKIKRFSHSGLKMSLPVFARSEQTKDYGYEYFGKLTRKFGIIMLLASISVGILLIVLEMSEKTRKLLPAILALVEILLPVIAMYITKKELRKKFDEDGVPKNLQ